MRTWLAVVAGVGAAFLGGVGVGRWSQPVKVIALTQKAEKQADAHAEAKATQQQAIEQEKKAIRKTRRWIPQPQNCGDKGPALPPIVEETEEEVSDRKLATASATQARAQDYHLLEKDERTLKVTERPAAKWHLTGLVGLTLSNPREVRSGLVLSHDLGPFQVGLWGMYGAGAAAGFSLGMSF